MLRAVPEECLRLSLPLTPTSSCSVHIHFFLGGGGSGIQSRRDGRKRKVPEGPQGKPSGPGGLENCKGFHIFTLKPKRWQKLNPREAICSSYLSRLV